MFRSVPLEPYLTLYVEQLYHRWPYLTRSFLKTRSRLRVHKGILDVMSRGSSESHIDCLVYEGIPRSVSKTSSFLLPIVPTFLARLFGFGLLDVAYADADTNDAVAKSSSTSESSSNHEVLEGIARKERQRLEEILKSKGLNNGYYPTFHVAVKGQKVTIKFEIFPTYEIPRLVANLVSNFGLKIEERGGGSVMTLRAWDSAVAWQLTHLAVDKVILSLIEDLQMGDLKEAGIIEIKMLSTADREKVESASSVSNFQAFKAYGRDPVAQPGKFDQVIGRNKKKFAVYHRWPYLTKLLCTIVGCRAKEMYFAVVSIQELLKDMRNVF